MYERIVSLTASMVRPPQPTFHHVRTSNQTAIDGAFHIDHSTVINENVAVTCNTRYATALGPAPRTGFRRRLSTRRFTVTSAPSAVQNRRSGQLKSHSPRNQNHWYE